ncbi:MAG: hypothetical protein WBC82_11150 [Dehalococcoidia bacterium]
MTTITAPVQEILPLLLPPLLPLLHLQRLILNLRVNLTKDMVMATDTVTGMAKAAVTKSS